MACMKKRILALLSAGAFCLTACSGANQSSAEENIILPEPEKTQKNQVVGDRISPFEHEVTFYYAPEAGMDLASMTRNITVKQGESLARNAVLELLSSDLTGSQAANTAQNRLLDVELGCGVATVDLSLEAGTRQTDQDTLLLNTAISNTLLGLDGIFAVNVLIGSRSSGICSLPAGVQIQNIDNLPARYAQLQSERDRFNGSAGASVSRNVLLYFPAGGKEYLLPELRELRFENDDYASVILSALTSGPLENSECCFSAVPANLELLTKEPQVRVTEAGERVIDLDFNGTLPNYLALSGIEAWQLYGSVVLSLCSFMPEVDAVHISMGGEAVQECILRGTKLTFTDGLMRRSDFSPLIGASATLYFTNEFGVLSPRECALSQADAISAKGILSEMMRIGSPAGTSLQSIYPADVHESDILGVDVENRIATVNLSGNFYARCQSMNKQSERNLVYGMINALAELPEIGAVRFLVEGMTVDTLVQDIYLGTALLPDPGMVEKNADIQPLDPANE